MNPPSIDRPSPGHRVNYDDIAERYDDPRRDHLVDPHLVAFVERDGRSPATLRILDVGCGTGKQLAADRERFPDATLIGVDRFAAMLRIARRRRRDVMWIHGDAEHLPLADDSVDYATSQFSYPHVGDRRRLFDEVHRVLRPDGQFVLTNIDPWSMPDWIVYRYFPEARDLDARDFLPVAQLVDLLRASGLVDVQARHQDLSQPMSLAAFLDSASARHSASQLMAIPDEAYARGLQRVADDVAAMGAGDDRVFSSFVLVVVTARKADRDTGAGACRA